MTTLPITATPTPLTPLASHALSTNRSSDAILSSFITERKRPRVHDERYAEVSLRLRCCPCCRIVIQHVQNSSAPKRMSNERWALEEARSGWAKERIILHIRRDRPLRSDISTRIMGVSQQTINNASELYNHLVHRASQGRQDTSYGTDRPVDTFTRNPCNMMQQNPYSTQPVHFPD